MFIIYKINDYDLWIGKKEIEIFYIYIKYLIVIEFFKNILWKKILESREYYIVFI